VVRLIFFLASLMKRGGPSGCLISPVRVPEPPVYQLEPRIRAGRPVHAFPLVNRR